MDNSSTHIIVRVSPDLRDRLKAQAEREERGLSAMVRLAAKKYLEAAEPRYLASPNVNTPDAD